MPETEFGDALKYALAEAERVGDPDKLPPPVRTVVLVHAAQCVIDNGDLQYFFEADFPRRPSYSVFVEAYRAIGADREADALAEAVNLFPFAEPHKHRRRRDRFMEQFMDDGVHRPDSPFERYTSTLVGKGRVWRLLERYVDRHAEWFSR